MYFNGITSTTNKIDDSTSQKVEYQILRYENHLYYVICKKQIVGLFNLTQRKFMVDKFVVMVNDLIF